MPLRVVHLEDNPHDCSLVAETLKAEQLDCSIVCVHSQDLFEKALAERPDLILSDYSIPGFGGDQAQAIASARHPDVPFIFVSGSIGEDRAVERLRRGATDYVLKERLDKLAPSVRRALAEAEERRRRADAETELRTLNAELEARVDERTRALVAANTELDEARREADRANQAKSEFLSRVSHDLRTPLNAILGFAQLLLRDPLTPDQSENATYILRGGQHLLNLIDEILDIARIESGNLSLSPEPVVVTEVLEHTVTLVRPQAQAREIGIVVDPTPGLAVMADHQRVRQILLNLLSNAVKYNTHGGTITIRSERVDGTVRISVADTGRGIPPDKLALLFTPFERLGAERTGIEGTGLGLALSKHLAELMGGQLNVSNLPAGGAVGQLTLPATRIPALEEPASKPATSPAPDSTGTVLYVEDNTSNVRLVEAILRARPGVILQHAPDGATALRMLETDPPDLVLLDLHLADMPGAGVLREITTSHRTKRIPVVVLSADATKPSHRALLSSGALAYLTKPIDVSELLRLIDKVLAHAEQQGKTDRSGSHSRMSVPTRRR